MIKNRRSVIAALVVAVVVAGLSGCQKKEGPAERAGKAIDNAVEKTEKQIDTSLEKVGEKLEEAGDTLKDAAHK